MGIIWNDIESMLCKLNDMKSSYAILRNFEEFANNKLITGHEDIDLICESVDELVGKLGAIPKSKDSIHFKVNVQNKLIDMDVRTVGDMYYDEKWEKEMLNNRVLFQAGYYVLCDEDYFYSLLYHGIYHKNDLKHEYQIRLKMLGKKIGIDINESSVWKNMMDAYLERQNYSETGYRSYLGGVYGRINKENR